MFSALFFCQLLIVYIPTHVTIHEVAIRESLALATHKRLLVVNNQQVLHFLLSAPTSDKKKKDLRIVSQDILRKHENLVTSEPSTQQNKKKVSENTSLVVLCLPDKQKENQTEKSDGPAAVCFYGLLLL